MIIWIVISMPLILAQSSQLNGSDSFSNHHRRDLEPIKSINRLSCHAGFTAKTIRHYSNLNSEDVSYYEEMTDLSMISNQIRTGSLGPFYQEMDIRRPEWIYTFGLFSGYSYCNSAADVALLNRPNPDLRAPMLPTGQFMIADHQEFRAYHGRLSNSRIADGRFYVAVNPAYQLITLTWRGARTANDVLAVAQVNPGMIRSPPLRPYLDRGLHTPQCQIPVDASDFFYFSGFLNTMQQDTLDRVVESLLKTRQTYPGYSIVINGHSLGGVKAMLTALYLSKFYAAQLPIAAVYAFNHPPIGSTQFNSWMSNCIGPQKIVRVVSSDDLVPWVQSAINVQHPDNVIEVFNPDPYANVWRRCMGPNNPACSAGIPCLQKSWKQHSRIGGLYMGERLCLYGQGAIPLSMA